MTSKQKLLRLRVREARGDRPVQTTACVVDTGQRTDATNIRIDRRRDSMSKISHVITMCKLGEVNGDYTTRFAEGAEDGITSESGKTENEGVGRARCTCAATFTLRIAQRENLLFQRRE